MNDLISIINTFSQKEFVPIFLEKHKKELKIKNKISNFSRKIFKKERENLVMLVNFIDGKNPRKYIFKLRFVNNIDLANKSFFINTFLFSEAPYLAPKPITYFSEYKIFVYEMSEGKSLNEIIKKEHNQKKINYNFFQAARAMAQLHKLDTHKIEENKNFHQFTAFSLTHFIVEKLAEKKDDDLKKEIILLIQEILKEIGKLNIEEKKIVHGDFQLENLIFINNLSFIDFDLSFIGDPLVDFGNFLVQLCYGGIMTKEIEKEARKLFFNTYLDITNYKSKDLFKRINLAVLLAHIRNINFYFYNVKNQKKEIVIKKINKMKNIFNNLDKDPLSFF